jgi:hypothetical protein
MLEMTLSNMLAFKKTKSSFSDLYIYIYIYIVNNIDNTVVPFQVQQKLY